MLPLIIMEVIPLVAPGATIITPQVGDHLKDHLDPLTQQMDVLLLIQACPQARVAILQIQVMGVTHPHPTIGLMLDPTPAAEDTPHPLIPHHRDRVGPHIRVMGHPQQMGVHPHLAMRRPQEGITDKVIMVLDLVIHLAARNLGHPQARAGHLLPRQRPVVVGHPRAQAALLQASMDSSRRITISISLSPPVEHQDNQDQGDHPAAHRDLFSLQGLHILKRNPQGLLTLRVLQHQGPEDHLKQPPQYLRRGRLPREEVHLLPDHQEQGLPYLLA